MDEKYIVLPNTQQIKHHLGITDGAWLRPQIIEDAVVIRRQDYLAATTLATYGGLALSTIEILERVREDMPWGSAARVALTEEIDNLTKSMEYFQAQADLAHQEGRKLPD